VTVPAPRSDDRPVLLDVNLLVALTWPDHVLHGAAQRWFSSWSAGWATSPITESGFLRVSLNPRVAGEPLSWSGGLDMLAEIRALPGHRWWADEVDLYASEVVRRAPVVGHRQVTDVHLTGLAAHHSGRLATLDEGVREALHPDHRDLVVRITT
jgi:hypothetical protein